MLIPLQSIFMAHSPARSLYNKSYTFQYKMSKNCELKNKSKKSDFFLFKPNLFKFKSDLFDFP
jgi:hypothetical protein